MMWGRTCCVKNCRRRSHDHRGRKIPNGLTFHCFPAWRRTEGGLISALTQRRRKAWVSAVDRSDVTFTHIPTSMRVCSRHFISGKPAYEMLESDPDWLPSLHLGHDEGSSRHTAERLPLALQAEKSKKKKKKPAERESAAGETLQTPAAAAGATECRDAPTHTGLRRPVVPLWVDVKSLLQSVLQKKPKMSEKPGDETHEQPAAVETNLSFKDFFRDALEASLDACSRSSTASSTSTSRPPYKVELNFQLPPLKVEREETCEESSSSSSSSCLNCVRLQKRLEELEERLPGLSGGPEDAESAPGLSPRAVHVEEEEHAWLQDCYQDVDSADDSTPLGPAGSSGRRAGRFQKSWLKMFWFLRYSPTQDVMWCHVCRLHAVKAHHNLALIKGSQMFRVHTIKMHSYSNHHRDSVERHLLAMTELQL